MSAINKHSQACVALIGRSNVGKSTLFNRLVGRRKAVVSIAHGTTRDRVYGEASWKGSRLTLIDAGGFNTSPKSELDKAVQSHVEFALRQADMIMLVCDGRQGLLPMDKQIAERARKTGKRLMLVVNKLERHLTTPLDFYSLGLEPIIPVSALHGTGTGELLDVLYKAIVGMDKRQELLHDYAGGIGENQAIAVAIVGRQNVGKSSLLNAMLRQERVIVSSFPGTTRDAIDTTAIIEGQSFVLIDTAGLRNRRKIKSPIELFAMSRSMEAIGRCDVALLVIDITQGILRDDKRLVAPIVEAGCGVVILANKWDLLGSTSQRQARKALLKSLPYMGWAPIMVISAKTGFGVREALSKAARIAKRMRRGMPDDRCSALLKAAWQAQPPVRIRGRAIHLKRARCVPNRPIIIELITSPAGEIPRNYSVYLSNSIRKHPSFCGLPIKLIANEPPRLKLNRKG